MVVLGHLPILLEASGPYYLLWDHAEVLELIESNSVVVAYLAGHDHAGGYALRAGVHHLTLPGMLEAPEETFLAIGMLTRHTHAHDGDYDEAGSMQVGALGEGIIDHDMPLNLLKRGGYNGYFSLEVIHAVGSDHDADGVLRQYAQEFLRLTAAS